MLPNLNSLLSAVKYFKRIFFKGCLSCLSIILSRKFLLLSVFFIKSSIPSYASSNVSNFLLPSKVSRRNLSSPFSYLPTPFLPTNFKCNNGIPFSSPCSSPFCCLNLPPSKPVLKGKSSLSIEPNPSFSKTSFIYSLVSISNPSPFSFMYCLISAYSIGLELSIALISFPLLSKSSSSSSGSSSDDTSSPLSTTLINLFIAD